MSRTTIETNEYTLTCEYGQEVNHEVFGKLLDFYLRHSAFCGEAICQMDKTVMEAPELLSDIAEKVFQFKLEWK